MTGRERLRAAACGGKPDRPAFLPITMMFAADTAGVAYGAYASDHRVLAEAQERTAATYGIDYVSAISDPAREASDLGAAVEWFDNQPPAIIEQRALLADKDTLGTLRIPDPMAGTRMRDRVEGVALLRRRVGTALAVEGWIEGPCAMAADLRGLNTLMLDFYDDAGFVGDLMDFVLEMEIGFARAQVEAGADMIGIGDAAASLIGPKLYRQFAFERERRLVEAVREMGAIARLHICGATRRIFAEMGACGADIVDLDYLAPVNEARRVMGPGQVLLGNIDPVRVVRDGTPESIEAALARCHAEAGANWIAGAGCEIPRGTPPANLHAMAHYSATHGREAAAAH